MVRKKPGVKHPGAKCLGAKRPCPTSGISLWLCHFLGPLNDCDASCASLWLWYFLCLFMIVTLPEPLWLWHASWLWNFLCHFMIASLPEPLWLWRTSWLWNFLLPLYDCDSLRPLYDCGVLLLSIKFDWWIGATWYRWSNMLVWELYLKHFKLPWPWPSGHGWGVGMVLAIFSLFTIFVFPEKST